MKTGAPKYASQRKTAHGGVGQAVRAAMEKQVAGLPLGFWVVVAVAVVAALGMGVSLMMSR